MITVKGINETASTGDISHLYDQYQDPHEEPQSRPDPTLVNSANNCPEDVDARIHEQARIARGLGASVEITGKWVWATFTEKPSKEARATLKTNAWIWCQSKGKWAWRGVKVSSRRTMDWNYITTKYGCQKLDASKELVAVS